MMMMMIMGGKDENDVREKRRKNIISKLYRVEMKILKNLLVKFNKQT